jgi:hypothetical protein
MLSSASRMLTYLTAILYAILGLLLFFLPEQLAPVFAWKVTPFMTMTIGGWCLGNAWLAFTSARRWDWRLVYAALYYLWAFGVLELVVLFVFRANLSLAHPIAWLYLITLCVNVLTAIVGLIDIFRIRPRRESFGPPARPLHHGMETALVIFVALLGLYGITARIGDVGTNGGIFPEIMSLFTLRSFAVFYLSLALGALPLIRERNLATLLHHAYASYALIIFITLAIVFYLEVFDFANQPGQLLYPGAYLAAGIPTLIILLREGTGPLRGPT